jgi:hypothetical protein
MDVRWLEDFLLLAASRSFARAAAARHVSQAAFGRRIKAIEAWVGVPLIDRSEFPVDGLEDVRLNVIGWRIVASGTVRNAAGRDGLARIGVGDVVCGEVQPVVLDEPVPGRHEKNWMPLLGTETWLYSCHEDGRVVTVSRQGDRWVLTPRGASPLNARGFRGGSQLVPHGEARQAAEAMAREIARFPQAAVRADRRTVHESHGLPLRDAMRVEWANGVEAHHQEGADGAGRFASGLGRGGDFGRI